MDQAAFIRWALDDARTVEERYTTQLIVEMGVNWWNSRHKIYKHYSLEESMERQRQRALNPAYDPRYAATDVEHAAAMLPEIKTWSTSIGLIERQIRDLKVFAFLPNLESFSLTNCEVPDVSLFAELPHLKVLQFSSTTCEDVSPIARCTQLRELALSVGAGFGRLYSVWPDVTGLERLVQLEKLSLMGNLLAFAPGLCWPNVRVATLKCGPLPARDVRRLPQLPACEILTLAGVERLDGIAAFPLLRNLRLESDVREFTPLTVLDRLTCFTCCALEPVEVSPLARLPRLQVATFDTRFISNLNPVKPRDFAVFAEAPALRELNVLGCPPVESEVQTLNTLLATWNDDLLAPAPRSFAPVPRFIIGPCKLHPQRNDIQLDPEDHGLPDDGLRDAEGRWVARFAAQAISAQLGCTDWGSTAANAKYRQLTVTIEAFAVVEKLPAIIAATRSVLAQLRHEFIVTIYIFLKAPAVKPSPAQLQLEKQFRDKLEEEDWERRDQERKEYIERLHRLDLKKQLGDTVKPEEFAPPPRAPLPSEVEEPEEEDDDNGDGDGEGNVKVAKKPDPPAFLLDDEHPLADNYRMAGVLTLTEFWVGNHLRDIATYLMGREPDQEFPEEKPAA